MCVNGQLPKVLTEYRTTAIPSNPSLVNCTAATFETENSVIVGCGITNSNHKRISRLDSSGNIVGPLQVTLGDPNWVNEITDIKITPSGDIYVFGHTYGAFGGNSHIGLNDYTDLFLMKIDSTGIVWTQMFGSILNDQAYRIVYHSQWDQIYAVGTCSESVDGELYSGGGSDICFFRWTSDGTRVWSRMQGSTGADIGASIQIGRNYGEIIISGSIQSNGLLLMVSAETGELLRQTAQSSPGCVYTDSIYFGRRNQLVGVGNCALNALVNYFNATSLVAGTTGTFGYNTAKVHRGLYFPSTTGLMLSLGQSTSLISQQNGIGWDPLLFCSIPYTGLPPFPPRYYFTASAMGDESILNAVVLGQSATLRIFVNGTVNYFADVVLIENANGTVYTPQPVGSSNFIPTSRSYVSSVVPPSSETTHGSTSAQHSSTSTLSEPPSTTTAITATSPARATSIEQDYLISLSFDPDSSTGLRNRPTQRVASISLSVKTLVGILLGATAVILILAWAFYSVRRREKKSNMLSSTFDTTDTTMQTTQTTADSTHTKSSTNMTTIVTIHGLVTKFMIVILGLSVPGYLSYSDGTDFRRITQIQRGGMGDIYMADTLHKDLKVHGNEFVVKTVKDDDNISENMRKSLFQEITIMHLLSNERNIAQLLGFCEKPLSLLMKYYPKDSLYDFIRRQRSKMTKKVVSTFSLDAARAISVVQIHGIAHCDIKTSNFLIDVDSDGYLYCVLTDFGISQVKP